MSYEYRKGKREKCHSILKFLNVQHDLLITVGEMQPRPTNPLSLVNQKDFKEVKYLSAVINELASLGHITCGKDDDGKPTIALTDRGMDAYWSSYHLKEIEKDKLESIELKTKWILPLVSAGISILALVISLYSASKK